MPTIFTYSELANICKKYRTSEGLRVKEGRESYTADLSGTPLCAEELDAVVIHGMYPALCDTFTAIMLAFGVRPQWATDNIGPYLTLSIDIVDLGE